jgi:hypothetical protein
MLRGPSCEAEPFSEARAAASTSAGVSIGADVGLTAPAATTSVEGHGIPNRVRLPPRRETAADRRATSRGAPRQRPPG